MLKYKHIRNILKSRQIYVYLNEPQFVSFKKGNLIQLTNSQFQSHEGKHIVDI